MNPSESSRPARPSGIQTIGFLSLSAFALVAVLGFTFASAPLTRTPTTLADALAEARRCLVGRDFQGAEKLVRPLVDSGSGPESKLLLGRILKERGRLNEAKALFSEILTAERGNLEAAWGLAECYSGLGQSDLAIALWSRATELAPRNPRLWKELGMAQREKGDLLAALSSFQESLSLDSAQEDLNSLMSDLAGKVSANGPKLQGTAASATTSPSGPRLVDPESLIPRPRPVDPMEHFPKPGLRR